MFTTSQYRLSGKSRRPLTVFVLGLLAGSSHAALAQMAPPPSYAPIEIPLDIVGETTTNKVTNPTNPYPDMATTGYRLGINIGLAGAKPVEYILDTGSTAFNTSVGSKYGIGPGVAWFDPKTAGPIVPASELEYGDGSYGNLTSSTVLPSIEFYDVTGKPIVMLANPRGIPLSLNTGGFATKNSLGVAKAGPLVGYYLPNYHHIYTLAELKGFGITPAKAVSVYQGVPAYLNQTQQDTVDAGKGALDMPAIDRFYGIFGAGDFSSDSVLGGFTQTGYVVAANGEVGANHDCDTTCAHLILNLTPAIRAQFKNILPWNSGAGDTFPMSNAPVSASEFDVTLDYTLTDGIKAINGKFHTLLDSGTGSYTFMENKFLADAQAAGFFDAKSTANDAGTGNSFSNVFSGLTLSASAPGVESTSLTTANQYYGDATTAGTIFGGAEGAIYGLPFYFSNSVMYDLENERDGYSRYFVSSASIDTSNGGYAVTSDMRPQGIAGVITGSGAFHVSGGGSAQLSEANTYTGATIVDPAALLVLIGPVVSIASSSGVQVDGMFDISGVTDSNVQLQSMSGMGVVEMGAHVLELTNASGDFSGDFTDGGLSGGTGASLMVEGGQQTLSGVNTYTGLTTVTGGTLALKGGNALPDANQVVVSGTGSLQILDDETIGSVSGTGGGIVLNAALTTGGANLDTSFSGAITGSGSLVKSGTGVFTLGGANTYSGGTTINGGTLIAQGGSAIGDTSAVVMQAAGTLEIDDAEAIGSLSGDAGKVVLNAALATGNDNADTTYAGALSGTGGLIKQGSGNFQLSGTKTYSGGTTIEAGVLQGDTTSIQGDVVDNAGLALAQDSDGTYAGTISGSGSLLKVGAGSVTLTAANSYSGGTLIDGGTLAGDAASLQGDIADNATLKFAQADDGVYAGAVSGTGRLVKDGTGSLRLTGVNTYSGGTDVVSGTLAGDSTSLQGNIADGATVAFVQDSNGLFQGSISGAGVVIKSGSGTVILMQANSYSGGTTVEAGTLQGDTNSIQGNIEDNAMVVFAQGHVGTYAGSIGGTGGVTVVGQDGNPISFTGRNRNLGDTEIRSGLFNVDGVQENSRTVVDAGATLGGSGMSHGILVKSGGTVAPGHSVGTLLSDNAGIQLDPGSIYHVEINGSGLSDKLSTTGAAMIDGAVLNVTLEFGQTPVTLADLEARGSAVHYVIVEASGGVKGKFTTSLPQYVFFESDVASTGTEVTLSIGRNALSFSAAGGTGNEQSVGSGIAGLDSHNPIYETLLASATLKDAQTIEHQLSGEIHGDVAGAVLDDGAMLRDAIIGRINSRTQDAGAFWLKALDSAGITGTDGNAAKLNRQTNGLSGGVDTSLNGDWLLGAAAAYMSSPLRTAGMGSAKIDSYHFGAYSGGDVFGLSVRLGGTYDHYKARTVRQISVPALSALEQAHYGINEGSAFGEIGYRIVDGDTTLEPFADLSWTQANLGGFVETQGPAALQAKEQTVDRTQSILGARYTVAFRENETVFTPNLTLGWVRNFDGVTPNRRLGFVDGTDTNGFVVEGVTTNKDAALVRAGLDATVGSGFSLGVGYEGEFGARGQDQGARLDLRFNY